MSLLGRIVIMDTPDELKGYFIDCFSENRFLLHGFIAHTHILYYVLFFVMWDDKDVYK